jgi:hypothetical protein
VTNKKEVENLKVWMEIAKELRKMGISREGVRNLKKWYVD